MADFERTPMEKAASGVVLFVVASLVSFIVCAAAFQIPIESYDQYIWGLLTPFLKELSQLTVGRGGENGGDKPIVPPPKEKQEVGY